MASICLGLNVLTIDRDAGEWPCFEAVVSVLVLPVNSSRPRQNRRHFADDVFKCNFLIENVWIPIKIWLTFVPQGQINNIPALVQIMAWRRSMMISLLTHIYVTRPQWVKNLYVRYFTSYIHAAFALVIFYLKRSTKPLIVLSLGVL